MFSFATSGVSNSERYRYFNTPGIDNVRRSIPAIAAKYTAQHKPFDFGPNNQMQTATTFSAIPTKTSMGGIKYTTKYLVKIFK